MEYGYTSLTVIVDGALENDYEISPGSVSQILRSLEADAKRNRVRIEVYCIDHPHAMSDPECACAQYEQDHKPAYVFGEDG